MVVFGSRGSGLVASRSGLVEMVEEINTRSVSGPLFMIRVIHSIVWAFFAACIVAIPFFVAMRRIDIAGLLIAIVFVEVLVLVFNRWQCPLTGMAAEYTQDRRDNFDIFLPEWVARHNKFIFGSLYVIGIMLTLVEWLRHAA